MRALAIALSCACFVGGCGASSSQHASTVKKPAPAPAPAAETAKTEPPPAPQLDASAQPLPASVDAGEIQREKLMAVLAAGPGRFLQRIKVQRDLDAQGRFAGWKLVQIFPGEADIRTPLVPGDTLLRVNGQSVERPEQFKSLWDSLALSSELVLTVRRGVTQSDVRYRIVQERLPP